jgi:hypothetical protein
MRYLRIALTAAAACLLPVATPALAELGHADGCARCGGVHYTRYGSYGFEGVPAVGHEIGIPLTATALAPAPVSSCDASLYGARHELVVTMCRL